MPARRGLLLSVVSFALFACAPAIPQAAIGATDEAQLRWAIAESCRAYDTHVERAKTTIRLRDARAVGLVAASGEVLLAPNAPSGDAVIPHDDIPLADRSVLRYAARAVREASGAIVVALDTAPQTGIRNELVGADASLPPLDIGAEWLGFPEALARDRLFVPICVNPHGPPAKGRYTPFWPGACPESWRGFPTVWIVSDWSNVISIRDEARFDESLRELAARGAYPSVPDYGCVHAARPPDRDEVLFPHAR